MLIYIRTFSFFVIDILLTARNLEFEIVISIIAIDETFLAPII